MSSIWENTIIAWINAMNISTSVRSIDQVNESVIIQIIKKIQPDFPNSPVEFLKENFPNLLNSNTIALSSTDDYLCAATLLLIYVSFAKKSESEELRELMCTQLDNTIQVNIAEFLMRIQDLEDPFVLTLKTIKQEIFNYIESQKLKTSETTDCKTPIKINFSDNSFDSPLQGFFQTPKRTQIGKQSKYSHMCGHGDHVKCIKQLTSRLDEEELKKELLQEKLNFHSQKCNEYEIKLRNKSEEIKLLKHDWEVDSKKNEEEIKLLKNNIEQKSENEKKLKSELSNLENYVSTLTSDFSNVQFDKENLEYQLKVCLEKSALYESQLKESSTLNARLQEIIDIKEKELIELKENFVNIYKDEKSIDVSCVEGVLDTSVNVPENMGVVVDKLLKESIAENTLLKETIEELQREKNSLLNKIKLLNEQISLNSSTISELQNINKELNNKIDNFDISEKELCKVQRELLSANNEVSRLIKENSHLNEKNSLLNSSLQQALQDCRNSKMLLHLNFIKFAEDLKAVQQNLESMVNKVSSLTLEKVMSSNHETFSESAVVTGTLDEYRNWQNINELQEKFKVLDCDEIKSNPASSPDFIFSKDDKFGESYKNELTESKILIQTVCQGISDNLVTLKSKINELEFRKNQSLEDKKKLEIHVAAAEEKVKKLQSSYSDEIKGLQEKLEEKEKKVTDLEVLLINSRKKEQLALLENKMQLNKMTKLIKSNKLQPIHEGGDFTCEKDLCFNQPHEKLQDLQEQDPSDSLEEITFCNKTFDILNLEENSISEKTFSIKDLSANKNKSNSAWVVSPPSKLPIKKNITKSYEKKHVQGESWIIPLAPNKLKKASHLENDLSSKDSLEKPERKSNLIKSSSLSSIPEIGSPPTKSKKIYTTANTSFSTSDSNLVENDEQKKGEAIFSEICPKKLAFDNPAKNYGLVETKKEQIDEIFNGISQDTYFNEKQVLENRILELEKQLVEFSSECDRLKSALFESETKRKKDKETFEKNHVIIRQNITSKYESQLEHFKNEMKQLYNRELAKHKAEQSKLNSELREQNKGYKEHIDELRNQLWDLGEKLLQEQKLRRDIERNYCDLKKKCEKMVLSRDSDMVLYDCQTYHCKESLADEDDRLVALRQLPKSTFPTIPTEDEEEIFDNRFLEDMKTGHCPVEKPEGRLTELQYRNSLCLPHLKSSYPAETQFHNPKLFKENDLKFGLLQFGQESHSLTDSDHSMTRSLLPEDKGKKKEQTSYKRPGPPTPSKKGGRQSLQNGDLRLTPRNALRELNEQSERNKGTPNPLKSFFTSKTGKGDVIGGKDENTAPVTPRKKLKIFRKPFGARDY